MGKLAQISIKGFYTPITNKIINEVNKHSENLDTLSMIEQEVNTGKEKISLAITSKGVPSTIADSIETLANKIIQIPQEINTKQSDFSSFVAPSEYIWNIFEIARDLQKNNPHPEMGAFFVAEYYRGYDSLVLTGADAYLTCDGDYYAPLDKSVEVTHVWHDADNGKSNRHVVFYYMQDGYTFSNATESICPRRVALTGRCASFIVTGENRLTDVYVLGTLEHFEGGTTGNSWNPAQVIRNYAEHASGRLYISAKLVSCTIPELINVRNGGSLFYGGDCYEISLPNLKTLDHPLISAPDRENTMVSLVEIELPNLERLGSSLIALPYRYTSSFMASLKRIHLPKVKKLETLLISNSSTDFGRYNMLEEIVMEELEETTSGFGILETNYASRLNSLQNLKRLILPNLKIANHYKYSNWKSDFIQYPDTSPGVNTINLIDVEVGALETSFDMNRWNPTTVLSTPEGIATINANIRDHIAAKVSDRTGQSALTFTVSTNLYNNLEQETINAFTAKNWNVAGA